MHAGFSALRADATSGLSVRASLKRASAVVEPSEAAGVFHNHFSEDSAPCCAVAVLGRQCELLDAGSAESQPPNPTCTHKTVHTHHSKVAIFTLSVRLNFSL